MYANADVEFKFRDQIFQTKIENGEFEVKRLYKNDAGEVIDKWKGKDFVRSINSKEIEMDELKKADLYNNANSVVYFALLPYRLNDPAVNKQLMCTQDVEGEPYYKVEITFDSNGGGKDFEDSFIYWIHKEDFTVDYLAYSFHINGGGVRFRKAYNQRVVNGIRFQDYVNYTIDTDFPAHELDFAFETGKLRELSRIDLEDIQVSVK